ncbi:DUF1284 domain-containing protein [Candidatus Pacearchaeota archaeon]|nr:DUF1284 domain-containing protein [Candidatus Pacearchaeota archaeon]
MRKRLFSIQKRIKKNPGLKIKVIMSCDEVCNICPHRKTNECSKEPKINYKIIAQDYRVLNKLNIKENEALKAKDILNLSISKIKGRDLDWICGKCEFLNPCLKYGLNKSFINALK